MRKVGSWLGVALTMVACGGDFDPSSRLTGLRLIAMRATKSTPTGTVDGTYAKPGERVFLEALAYDGKARQPGRAIATWAWTVCVRPLSGTVLGCFQKIAADAARTRLPPSFVIGKDRDRFDFTIPADALDGVPKETQPGAMVGVVVAICPGTLQLAAQAAKNSLPFSCTYDDGTTVPSDDFILAFKRIFLRSSDQNQNPIINGVSYNGKVWEEGPDKAMPVPAGCGGEENRFSRCEGDKPEIRADIDPKTFEAGIDEFGTVFTEQVIVQYYADEGLFESDVRRAQEPQTKFVLRQGKFGTEKPGLVHVWIVARDNRGGANWLERWAKPL